MGWTRARRTAAAAAISGLLALVPAAPAAPAGSAGEQAGRTPSSGAAEAEPATARTPPPPRLPRNFSGKGRWIVRDLGIEVPFRWAGRDGDSQMVAGGPQYPIWFTNLIYRGTLYTLTYKWPGLTEHTCSKIPGFDRERLNALLAKARFVGRETLERTPRRRVNHWRVGVVLPQRPPGNHLRFPLALGDVYVDQRDPGTFWQVLQFGVQNLFDPELDEWLVMNTFAHRPGEVKLPRRCRTAS